MLIFGKVRRRWLERPPRESGFPISKPPRRCTGTDGRKRRADEAGGEVYAGSELCEVSRAAEPLAVA